MDELKYIQFKLYLAEELHSNAIAETWSYVSSVH